MKYFTQEGCNPNERTLEIIRQIAHSYRVVKMTDGTNVSLCIN